MNRVLKQRFNQISRQNNYMMAMRTITGGIPDSSAATKAVPARPVSPSETRPSSSRRI